MTHPHAASGALMAGALESWVGGQIFLMGRRLADLEKEEASAVAGWEGAGNPTINVIKSWQDKLRHTRHTGVCG